MFNATLDSVGSKLEQTETAVLAAIGELTGISGLTWHSMAGKAFIERSTALAQQLNAMLGEIRGTQAQLISARNELEDLERQIMQLQLAG